MAATLTARGVSMSEPCDTRIGIEPCPRAMSRPPSGRRSSTRLSQSKLPAVTPSSDQDGAG